MSAGWLFPAALGLTPVFTGCRWYWFHRCEWRSKNCGLAAKSLQSRLPSLMNKERRL